MAKRAAKSKTKAVKSAKADKPGKPGRPPFYSTPKQLLEAVQKYADLCDEKREPLTMSGLAYFLGFADRSGLDETAKRDGFSLPVKRAKLLVEMSYERRLTRPYAAGAIFALKNFGWKDTQEIKHHDGDLAARIEEARNRANSRA